MRMTAIVFCMVILLSLPTDGRADVTFDGISGSDLIIGVGARAIAMGGAFVSLSDDASAIFWNPAGMTQLAENQLYFSTYVPWSFNAAALVYKPGSDFLESRDVTVGLGSINRLTFQGDSHDGIWDGYAAHLLDVAMISVGDDFSGSVDSKTRDLRLSLSMVPKKLRELSLGATLTHVS